MTQHRPINLLKDVGSNVKCEIGPNSEDGHPRVEGGVVDLAQSEPVGHDWLSLWFAIGDDVRCVDQLQVPEVADRAATVVGVDDLRTEDPLMQASLGHPLDIPSRVFVKVGSGLHEALTGVES